MAQVWPFPGIAASDSLTENGGMVAAILSIDFADEAWFPGQTLSISLEPEEHVFRRAVLGYDVRGVFADIRGRRAMLLRHASQPFKWTGSAVSIVVPGSGVWPEGRYELDQLHLESVGKAVVKIVED